MLLGARAIAKCPGFCSNGANVLEGFYVSYLEFNAEFDFNRNYKIDVIKESQLRTSSRRVSIKSTIESSNRIRAKNPCKSVQNFLVGHFASADLEIWVDRVTYSARFKNQQVGHFGPFRHSHGRTRDWDTAHLLRRFLPSVCRWLEEPLPHDPEPAPR